MTTDVRNVGLYEELVARWPTIAATIIVLFMATILPNILRRDPLASLPTLGTNQKDFMTTGWNLYTEGHKKARNLLKRLGVRFY